MWERELEVVTTTPDEEANEGEWAELVADVQEALEIWWDESRTAAVVRSYVELN